MPTNIKDQEKDDPHPPLRHRIIAVNSEKSGEQYVPALDKFWATRSVFASCSSPLTTGGHYKSGVALEEWQHGARNFRDDMEFLLYCKHHEFWSYMVYQQSIRVSLATFLQRAIPYYLYGSFSDISNDVKELYESVLSVVIRIIFRLLTSKESCDDWIEQDHHEAIISKHNLLTVPMIFDAMIAIGNISEDDQESLVVAKLVKDYLRLMENSSRNDWQTSLNFFHNAFRSIRTQVLNEGCEGAAGGPPADEITSSSSSSSTETQFDDVTLYTLDCVCTLKLVLELWPNARNYCIRCIDLGYQIANFYNDTLKLLYMNVFQCNANASSLKWLNLSRAQLLHCYRYLVATDWHNSALNNPENCDVKQVELFLDKMEECSNFDEFIADYLAFYPLEDDESILKNLNCYSSNVSLRINSLIKKFTSKKSDAALHQEKSGVSSSLINGLNGSNQSSANVDKRDIELEITMVLDCLPQLERDFVRKLLSRYESSELAIAAYLENNLPPDLSKENEGQINSDADKFSVPGKEILVMKRGKGFPIGPQNASELLDNKSDLAEIRHRYQEYTMVTDDDEEDNSDDENDNSNNNNNNNNNDLYEDEWDDSYEGLLEGTTTRLKIINRRNQFSSALAENVSDDDVSDNESTASSNDDSQSKPSKNNLDFCEDPALARARREAQYRAKWARKGVSLGAGTGDVKGRAKGQGQDKEVLLNRQRKKVNKSHSGNHNRKAGAAFKRNRGMFS